MSGSDLKNSNIKFYPNPTNNFVNIYLSEIKPTAIRISDVTGKLILEDNMNESKKSIDLSSYNSGIYFIQLTDNNDSRVVKLVKE